MVLSGQTATVTLPGSHAATTYIINARSIRIESCRLPRRTDSPFQFYNSHPAFSKKSGIALPVADGGFELKGQGPLRKSPAVGEWTVTRWGTRNASMYPPEGDQHLYLARMENPADTSFAWQNIPMDSVRSALGRPLQSGDVLTLRAWVVKDDWNAPEATELLIGFGTDTAMQLTIPMTLVASGKEMVANINKWWQVEARYTMSQADVAPGRKNLRVAVGGYGDGDPLLMWDDVQLLHGASSDAIVSASVAPRFPIYPNLGIRTKGSQVLFTMPSASARLQLFSLSGKVLFEAFGNDKCVLSTGPLPRGTYVVRYYPMRGATPRASHRVTILGRD